MKLPEIEIEHINSPQDLKSGAKIIVSHNQSSINGQLLLKLHRNMTSIQIKQLIMKFTESNSIDYPIVIGIDPGINIGIAILQNQKLLTSTIVLSFDRMIQWMRDQLKSLQAKNILIKVGDGVKEISKKILERVFKEFNGKASIYIVDETSTSIKETNTSTIHEQSAIIIAKRKGNRYNGQL